MDKKYRFGVVVCSAPYGSQGASSAYLFCKTLLESGHHLTGVFFYQDGVLNANQLTSPAGDEINLVENWRALAQQYIFPLEVCLAAGLRRGVIDQQGSQQSLLKQFNLEAPFALSGLTQLAEISKHCDRLLQFK